MQYKKNTISPHFPIKFVKFVAICNPIPIANKNIVNEYYSKYSL